VDPVQRREAGRVRRGGGHGHEIDVAAVRTKVAQDRRAGQVQPLHETGGLGVDRLQEGADDVFDDRVSGQSAAHGAGTDAAPAGT